MSYLKINRYFVNDHHALVHANQQAKAASERNDDKEAGKHLANAAEICQRMLLWPQTLRITEEMSALMPLYSFVPVKPLVVDRGELIERFEGYYRNENGI